MRLLLVLAILVFVLLLASVLVNSVELWRLWSFIGDEEFYMAFSLLLFYLYPSPSTALIVLLSVVLSGSINVSLKYWLNTPRPPSPLVPVEGPGFPSGHAQVSTSFWFTISWIRRDYALFFLSVVTVAGVSLSRVYLNAHYPVDVLGGVLIGLFISLIVSLSERIAGYLGCRVLAILSLVFSFTAFLILSAPSDSCSVLAATSLVLLLIFWVYEKRGFKSWAVSLRLRLISLFFSLFVVFALHTVTMGALFTVRFSAVFAGVLLALSFPLLCSSTSMVKC